MEIFSKGIAAFLLLIAMFVVPLSYYGQKQEAQVQVFISDKTAHFVDTVREQGKITQDAYQRFMQELDATGFLYRVSITQQHSETLPVTTPTGFASEVTESMHYEDEILYAVFERVPSAAELAAGEVAGEYHFTKGDYVTVTVQNKDKSIATKLKEMLAQTSLGVTQIYATYGGEIRDENF